MRKLSLCFLLFFSAVSQAQFTDTKPKIIDVPEDCNPVANHYMVRTPKSINIPDSINTLSVSTYANYLSANYGGVVEAVFGDTNSSYGGFSIVNLSANDADNMLKNESSVLRIEQVCYFKATSIQSNPYWALDRIDQAEPPLDQSFDTPSFSAENKTHIYLVDQAIRGYFPETNILHQDLTAVKAPENHEHFASTIPVVTRNSLACTIHGTAVAGVIAGARTGIARNSILHSYAAFNCASPPRTNTAWATNA
ncbi:MAG: hypothetical protein MI750_09555, partial [Xanthomonadales bacterium]|nr:hypothetical protein [Xanthomonadales bacterium]